MATNSSVLAWEIPWTEEPGRLQSLGSQSQTLLSMHARVHTHTHYGLSQGTKYRSLCYAVEPCC